MAVGVKYRIGDRIEITFTGNVTNTNAAGEITYFVSESGSTRSVKTADKANVKLLARAFSPGTLYRDSGTGVNWLYSKNAFWYQIALQDGGMHAYPEIHLKQNGITQRLVELIPYED